MYVPFLSHSTPRTWFPWCPIISLDKSICGADELFWDTTQPQRRHVGYSLTLWLRLLLFRSMLFSRLFWVPTSQWEYIGSLMNKDEARAARENEEADREREEQRIIRAREKRHMERIEEAARRRQQQ